MTMKKPLISLLAVALGFCVSCKEKSEEVKKVEETTKEAVAAGKMTEEEAKTVNEIAEKADEMKGEALEIADKQLKALEGASTPEELRAAVKDATKANVEMAVRSGIMAKEQADLTLQSLDSIDQLPEPALQQMVEQLKAGLRQVKEQVK